MRLIAYALLLAILPAAARAEAVPVGTTQPVERQIDFSAPILDDRGNVVMDETQRPVDPATRQPDMKATVPALTLGLLASHVLFSPEQGLSAEDSWKRGSLGMRLRDGGKIALQAADVDLIKRLVAKAYSPLIVFRVWALLGEPPPK